ncbi:hypothetical protein [Helicobacter sp. MIT 01-3238]|uniref:hypothetical protein n=1 Tax=Helicobacter sp. MIT 01-3238 TaxID=398627 RepID=UPI000E1EF56E|nr:hypothetical protein [Helicobacter sp. MIT 01-3238]RDU53412.1 hypothetical protein CQA40_05525 [Helicobacter sp. MIT 01-3238]
MKKLSLVFMVSLALGLSSLSAEVVQNQASQHKEVLQQSDMDFLFKTDKQKELNIVVLDEDELKATQGEAWSWRGFLKILGEIFRLF